MKKFLVQIAVLSALFFSVEVSASAEAETERAAHYLRTSSKEPLTKQMDMNDLSGCPILIGNVWDGYDSKNGAGIDQIWLGVSWRSYSGISLDSSPENKSYNIQKSSTDKLVYVGKWQYINKIGKNVRLISAQATDDFYHGSMRNYFESMDDQNKKIPATPLKLIKPTHGDELCILKWHNKYGYNAIAENYRQLRPGFWNWLFRNHELVITGKVIDAETGEIIADEKNNLNK